MSAGLARARDAYGAILLDALEGRQAYEIIERDDGVVWAGTPEDYFAPHRRWPAAERGALRSARGRVLDIGCGAGRVSLHLQGRGLEVVAVDESPGAVEVCRRRGVRDARVVPLTAIDEALGDFDTILLLRNNFGLAGPRRAPAVLRRLAAIARPGAVLITDSVDPRRAEHEELRADGSAAPRIRVRWRDRATPWFTYLMLRARPDGGGGARGRLARAATRRGRVAALRRRARAVPYLLRVQPQRRRDRPLGDRHEGVVGRLLGAGLHEEAAGPVRVVLEVEPDHRRDRAGSSRPAGCRAGSGRASAADSDTLTLRKFVGPSCSPPR